MSGPQICIVGGGPRGTSVLERIHANVRDLRPGETVTVHVVDPYPAGPGAVWRTGQSGHLLMNTVCSQLSLYTDESVTCTGPIVPGPSLYEWTRWLVAGALPGPYPGEVRAEAQRLGPDDYPSRRFYGHYLRWAFQELVRTAGPRLSIRVHRAAAIALDDDADGRQVVTLADGRRLVGLHAVVLALGHGPRNRSRDEDRLRDFARRHALRYVAPANPADVDLSAIAPGERVVLRGLGLTFFDHLSLLTEGRGGRFERSGEGLVYHRSGREPVLFAGSRRGVPYHARGENQKGVAGRHQPRFLTGPAISRLRVDADYGGHVGFREHVWPLIDREVRLVYHHALVAARRGPGDAAEFLLAALDGAPLDGAPLDGAPLDGAPLDGGGEDALLTAYGVAPGDRWTWAVLERPTGGRGFADPEDFSGWLLGYLRADVTAARQGNLVNPLKAALDVLRDLRNEIRLVVDHAGISGDSYRDELEDWYGPLNAFASIGPPVRRIAETIALIEAGVLRVLGPALWVRPSEDDGRFVAGSGVVPGSQVSVDALIEARLPEFDLRHSADPLLRYLLATGQCQPYRIPRRDAGHYESGGLAVTRRPYRVVDATGRAHPRRFAYGIPTEAVHWLTAAGIRPGVGSVTLEDADAIARAALTAAPAGAPDPAGVAAADVSSDGLPSVGLAEGLAR